MFDFSKGTKELLKKYGIEYHAPASHLSGELMSSYFSLFPELSIYQYDITNALKYYRYHTHPINAMNETSQAERDSTNDLNLAYIGAIQNSIEKVETIAGKKFSLASHTPHTSMGDGYLHELMLNAQHESLSYILNKLSGHNLQKLVVNTYFDYPCLMIRVRQPTTLTRIYASYLWTTFLIAHVTYLALMNHIPIEITRRGSFGFLKPVFLVSDATLRISLGMVPEQYLDLLAQSILVVEQVMQYAEDHFYDFNTAEIKQLINHNNEGQIITPLFFERLLNKKSSLSDVKEMAEQFMEAVKDATTKQAPQLQLPHFEKRTRGSLSFSSSCAEYFKTLLHRTKIIFHRAVMMCTISERIIENMHDADMLNFYKHIEIFQELLYHQAVTNDQAVLDHDGYGSDSETETKQLYAKKIITHNGMRAIMSVVQALNAYSASQCGSTAFTFSLRQAYYEVRLALLYYEELMGKKMLVEDLESAALVIYNMNCAVMRPSESIDTWPEILCGKHQYLMIDIISAQPRTVSKKIQEAFGGNENLKAIFLVTSGLKFEQLGSDKNMYGSIRIITKQKQLRDTLYQMIKNPEIEQPTKSMVAHNYRRLMKTMGSVPGTKDYLGDESAKVKGLNIA